MALDSTSSSNDLAITTHRHQTSVPGWPIRRKIWFSKRKLPTIRLGGQKKPRRRYNLVRMMKLRWLKLKYIAMMKKMRENYRSLINDIVQGGATIDAFQQRLIMETSFGVPVMGMSFNYF